MTLPVAGNIRSGKYHLPNCSGYSQGNLKNHVEFGNEAEAEARGIDGQGIVPGDRYCHG